MMSVLLAALLQASSSSQAGASLSLESALKLSTAAPIQLQHGRVSGPVVIGVEGDPNRAYRLQVQSSVPQDDGQVRVVSAASGDIDPQVIAHTGASGADTIRITGAAALLRSGPDGRPVLPLRIVYE